MNRFGSVCVIVLALVGSICVPRLSRGATPAPQQEASGEAVFQRICAACHLSLTSADTGGAVAGIRALPRELLQQFAPEAILNTLTNGKMQAQAASLSTAERRAVAVYVSGRDFGPAVAAPEDIETNLCTEQLVMGDPQASPSWNGWGNGPANTRFQPKAQGKLTAADLPRLQLKWAFGFSNVMTARPSAAVVQS